MSDCNSTLISQDEFWSWGYSDFLSNSQRGVLAEFIVGKSLCCLNKGRKQWDAYDLKLDSGHTIEVKSAAYLQSWKQEKPSSIRFDIESKKSWFSEENLIAKEKLRPRVS